ncbi:DNA-directed RNA polymerase iii subunit rpc8 [Anaeramoeba flamelloides]|uniref:DNA-directed RNA polymerase iii subunit rpc8 n=1 Tax=Anaeramoeba flamelloides TaxID=1746091 RepID=A0ABQ8YQX6_9EUKA|nr:DNA-directed RNA polymerase iii subunit rpc8 [Anaeramoeba flamelloides]
MFFLYLITDTATIPPTNFSKNIDKILKVYFNRKYSNKVIINVGLVLFVSEIAKIGKAFVHVGDGSAHINTQFRVVVFRPYSDEVIEGEILDCDPLKGVQISCKFFQDIYIPPKALKKGTKFDETESLWVWHFVPKDPEDVELDPIGGSKSDDDEEDNNDNSENEENNQETHLLFMEIGRKIRFRVNSIKFREDLSEEKLIKPIQEKNTQQNKQNLPISIEKVENENENINKNEKEKEQNSLIRDPYPKVPLIVFGSVKEDGLGLVEWWADPDEDELLDEENEDNFENDEK